MVFIRATLFNIAFYLFSAVICIGLLPLVLMGEKAILFCVKSYVKGVYFLEKTILGLEYEVRGLEYLPKDKSFIVAAKHQSAYETLKLHLIFDRPAIVLKKELLSIPIWGKFLAGIKPIAINRSQGKEAMKQIVQGAQSVIEDRRPIVIFPQGTRVPLHISAKEKPYKKGIVRLHEETALQIIPMALNSGVFWPRSQWTKYSGKVIIEFLPPLKDVQSENLLDDLEKSLEERSLALQQEAYDNYKSLPQLPQPTA